MKDEKDEILMDIFGSERNQQKGLIDSTSEDEYFAKRKSTRDKQRAVLGKGPYQLAGAYKHLEVSLLKWSLMTPSEKQNHVAKVDPSCKKTGVIPLAAEANDQCTADSTLGSFEDTGLPRISTWFMEECLQNHRPTRAWSLSE
ncbi:hypothetical protein OS493_002014 [Desmophyllum pertusum]|uniref:Uncharacterized protein n=1 Tax=Desmophyllum pertusum TaxID=174260 RepID=A0A9X0CT96_9CNID|nr:hypothetical protein OS493_002014 [Desmophyllum pertusum]